MSKKCDNNSNIISDFIAPIKIFFDISKDIFNRLIAYYKNNKSEVVIITYLIWLLIQILWIIFLFWFEGLSYVSIKFSLIIFTIIWFLTLISFPLVIFFIIVISIVIIPYFWFFYLIIYFLLFILRKFFPTYFEKVRSYLIKKFDKEKVNKLFLFYILFLTLPIVILLIWNYLSIKPVSFIVKDEWKLMWKLLFYNQDYYFFDICWEKVVYKSEQVNSIKYLCLFNNCNGDKLKVLNEKYSNLCINYLK